MAELLPTATELVRFWSKIEMRGPNECWPWRAAINRVTGYGVVMFRRRVCSNAARLVLAFALGRWLLPGELALHKCDVRACCNRAHLFVGSYADNARDMMSKGRGVGQFSQGFDARRLITVKERG